jgi:hypothetical protein
VREVIAVEVAARKDGVDDGKARRRAVAHRDRGGAVQLDDGRGIGASENIVQADNLLPVGGVGGCCFGMYSRDRGLQRVGAEPPRGDGALDQ